MSVTDLWQAIQEALGIELDAQYGPAHAGDVRDSLADLTKIGDHLSYRVKISLHQDIRLAADWLRSEGDTVLAGTGQAKA